jgi:hypothetical protein
MEAKMEGDAPMGEEAAGDAPEVNAEGGMMERRSNTSMSRRSVNSRLSRRSGQ